MAWLGPVLQVHSSVDPQDALCHLLSDRNNVTCTHGCICGSFHNCISVNTAYGMQVMLCMYEPCVMSKLGPLYVCNADL